MSKGLGNHYVNKCPNRDSGTSVFVCVWGLMHTAVASNGDGGGEGDGGGGEGCVMTREEALW